MFEHQKEQLASRRALAIRQLKYLFFALIILSVSLGLGIVGYHVFGGFSWIDSVLNASMILTGMGPADHIETTGGKLFASFYALFSGVAFLTFVGVLFAPVYHRFLHKFHLDYQETDSTKKKAGRSK